MPGHITTADAAKIGSTVAQAGVGAVQAKMSGGSNEDAATGALMGTTFGLIGEAKPYEIPKLNHFLILFVITGIRASLLP